MRVEISLDGFSRAGLVGLLLLGLTALGGLGAWATPVEGGRPVLLTPERWAMVQLARRARAETGQLQADLAALRGLLAEERPDPVAAMLLAQAVYGRHREGTPATAGARQALIQAAAAAARYAAGGEEYAAVLEALARCEEMVTRLEAPLGDGTGLPTDVAAAA